MSGKCKIALRRLSKTSSKYRQQSASSGCGSKHCMMRRSGLMPILITMMTAAAAACPRLMGKQYVTVELFDFIHNYLRCTTFQKTIKGMTKHQQDEATRRKLPQMTYDIVSVLHT